MLIKFVLYCIDCKKTVKRGKSDPRGFSTQVSAGRELKKKNLGEEKRLLVVRGRSPLWAQSYPDDQLTTSLHDKHVTCGSEEMVSENIIISS